MSYVRDFPRAIEGTRLLRYSPLLNSFVEPILSGNSRLLSANCSPAR
jgi:hypothetical protein